MKFISKKIILITLIAYIIYLGIALTTLYCPGVVRYCEAGGDEEVQILASTARTVPLSCAQTRTDEEYTNAYIENVIIRFTIPLLLISALTIIFPLLVPQSKRKTS